MKTGAVELLSVLVLSVLAGLCGCTPDPTNIDPPSGPVETPVCFDPTPRRCGLVGGETCGWWVELTVDDRTFPPFYTYEDCFELPYEEVDFFPGDVVTVEVTPDWFGGCGGFIPLPYYGCNFVFPTPPFDGLGVMIGTFTVTE